MLKALVTIIFMTTSFVAHATSSHHTRGYIKRDGTYVAPSRATNPNNTKRDNYSQKGNFNPYSGKEGRRK